MGFFIFKLFIILWQKQEKKQNQNQIEKIGSKTIKELLKIIEF